MLAPDGTLNRALKTCKDFAEKIRSCQCFATGDMILYKFNQDTKNYNKYL